MYFVSEYMFVTDDGSILLLGESDFYPDVFGVSNHSNFDVTLFKFNSSNDIEWVNSVDFLNNSEQASALIEFNNAIYISFIIDTTKFWIASFEMSKGLAISSVWFEVNELFIKIGYVNFSLLFITSKFLFAKSLQSSLFYSKHLFVFNPTVY